MTGKDARCIPLPRSLLAGGAFPVCLVLAAFLAGAFFAASPAAAQSATSSTVAADRAEDDAAESRGWVSDLMSLDPNPDKIKENWYRWLAWIAVGFFVLFILWWFLTIMSARSQRHQYMVQPTDEQPSVDERLLSELAPMEVALLRGNIAGFYEKVHHLTRQLLKTRGLLDVIDMSDEELIVHLHTLGIEPSFLDCVESILRRCDVVRSGDENPSRESHERLRRDMGTLIRMNPHFLGGGISRKREEQAVAEDE